MNPAQHGQHSLLSGNSLAKRLLVVGLALLMLIVVASVVINLLNSGKDFTPSVISVIQDQQELVHIVSKVKDNSQAQLSAANANLAATLQLTMSSSQAQLIHYLANNHHKVSSKQINLKVSATTDQQLTASAAAGTYDSTFISIVQTKLTAYQHDLGLAYQKDKGAKGRALLSSEYDQATLLLGQLGH